MVTQRLSSVLAYFKLVTALISTSEGQERLRGQARANLLTQSAHVLLPAGSYTPEGTLTLQLLQQLEGALGKFSALLGDSDFQLQAPLQRLSDLGERIARSHSAAAAATDSPSRMACS